jgi:hypothetical protein
MTIKHEESAMLVRVNLLPSMWRMSYSSIRTLPWTLHFVFAPSHRLIKAQQLGQRGQCPSWPSSSPLRCKIQVLLSFPPNIHVSLSSKRTCFVDNLLPDALVSSVNPLFDQTNKDGRSQHADIVSFERGLTCRVDKSKGNWARGVCNYNVVGYQ